ncbi:MAG TPA: ATP-binding protein [Candidatus Tectomicrobia bacterium]|jgi:histidine kinase
MKLLTTIRQRLGWKLCLSYLLVILAVVIVLDTTAEFRAPTALRRDVTRLPATVRSDPALLAALHASFQATVDELLAIGSAAAILVAVVLSIFTSRRIVRPIQAMMQASQRIAGGDYRHRVEVPGQDELGVLAHAFNQMSETLERTEQRRLEAIGDLAHELRTPLSSIKSMMEGLVDGVLVAEPATFLSVQREVARLQRLVHDLEELARVEADQSPLELYPVNMATLMHTAADRLQPQFEDKDVQLHLKVRSELPPVQADVGRLLQVLLNLLGNALQYTPSGGQVTVSACRKGQQMLIRVHDTGIGIAAEHLPFLYERFYRVDKSRTFSGGSGIGLTIARHLVEAHGGRIWATSPGPGQGSTFSFTLPLAD